jgi:colanic acid/amylovoran biosynthesis glycosyltransferase
LSKQRIKREWAWPENLHVIVNNKQNFRNIKDLGIPFKEARVIHSGIDINKFAFRPKTQINQPVQIIYPARIEPLKGQIDAVRLVAHLKNAGIKGHLRLVGPVNSEDYFQQVKDEVSGQGIDDLVTFLPLVTQEDLVKIYYKSDFCFFPTYHKMGFSRVPLEAMACGCVVISYGNEASKEIIFHEVNGYLVQEGDMQTIIQIIQRLIVSPKKYNEIIIKSRQQIIKYFSMEKYIDKIMTFLNFL